jgi:hypothetical protein
MLGKLNSPRRDAPPSSGRGRTTTLEDPYATVDQIMAIPDPTAAFYDDGRYYTSADSGAAAYFFSTVASGGATSGLKKNEAWYEPVAAILQAAPNLGVVHGAVFPSVTRTGQLALSNFLQRFVATVVPADTDLSYFRTWYRSIGAPQVVEAPAAAAAGSDVARSLSRTGRQTPSAAAKAPSSSATSPAPRALGYTTPGNRSVTPGSAYLATTPGAAEIDLILPYIDVLRALDQLFNRASSAETMRWAFDLCDLGSTGYILKDTMKHLRTRDHNLDDFDLRVLSPPGGAAAQGSYPRAALRAAVEGTRKASVAATVNTASDAVPDDANPAVGNASLANLTMSLAGGDVPAALVKRPLPGQVAVTPLPPTRCAMTLEVDAPEDLTYAVVKAILKAFEHIAAAEVERALAANKKGKKKAKKNAAPVLPTRRQFHINFDEFQNCMRLDPYIVAAFVPFCVKRWCIASSSSANAAPATRVSATVGASGATRSTSAATPSDASVPASFRAGTPAPAPAAPSGAPAAAPTPSETQQTPSAPEIGQPVVAAPPTPPPA